MREDSGDQNAAPPKASLSWAAKWAAVALCGAFTFLIIGALTGSNLASLAALVFPFAVWVGVIAEGQRSWGPARRRPYTSDATAGGKAVAEAFSAHHLRNRRR